MNYSSFFVIFFVSTFFSCHTVDDKALQNTEKYKISDLKILASEGHVAEGGLARLPNGNILVLYRKDPSFSHVSNSGEIMGKLSEDNGNSWGDEFAVYNSKYDDRNLVVGQLASGEVIVVFRRYDDQRQKTIDAGYIKSKNGLDWGNYKPIRNTEGVFNQPFGTIGQSGKTNSFLIAFENGVIKKYHSNDNFVVNLSEKTIIHAPDKNLQEPFEVLLDNNQSIILCRNGKGDLGEPSFFQFSSKNGVDYKYDGPTNIFDDFEYSVRSPISLTYSESDKILEVMGNSRYLYQTSKNEKNSIRIYTQPAKAVLKDSKAYDLSTSIARPIPSDHWFYGYPKSIDLTRDKRLYIISDAKIHDPEKQGSHIKNEDADLFYFTVSLKKE